MSTEVTVSDPETQTWGESMLPIALVGMGRMGRSIDAMAGDRDCEVVARLGADEMGSMTMAALGGARVAIEFTKPESALSNARTLLALGCPVVIGTTGWTLQLGELENIVRSTGTSALWAPNFSLGVHLFMAIAGEAAKRLREMTAFDVHVLEVHHAAKKDTPSGTGEAIGRLLREGLGHDVPVSSVRVGSVPGTHEILLDAPFEQIRLVHEARDRRVFADGALTAAHWLASQTTPGLYTINDMLRVTPQSRGQ